MPQSATRPRSVAWWNLKFVDSTPDDRRMIRPRLNPGTPATKIDAAAWLTRDGTTDAPDLAGKVVLIHFWGISCGPYMVDLSNVEKAAGRLREIGAKVIGLLEASAKADAVANFAREKGLTYPLAIDRTDAGDGYFGTTFRASGVRGIPAAAVLDREGRVAFVGRFPEALKKVEEGLFAGQDSKR
jgi:peroxiredoxin